MNQYFNSLDKDKTGMISIDDVLSKFEELNFRSSRLSGLKDMHAKNRKLKINYSDFITRVVDITREVEQDDLIKAFQHFDSDGSGKITKDDLKNLMKRKGENLTDAELDELLNQVDSSPTVANKLTGRTEINFETFRNYIYKLSPMSPSLTDNKPEGLKIRNREDNFSIDMCDDDTSNEVSNARQISIEHSDNSLQSPKNNGSYEFQVMFENN